MRLLRKIHRTSGSFEFWLYWEECWEMPFGIIYPAHDLCLSERCPLLHTFTHIFGPGSHVRPAWLALWLELIRTEMDNWLKRPPMDLEFELRSPRQVGHLNCRDVNSGSGGRVGVGRCKEAALPKVKNEASVQRWVTSQEWLLVFLRLSCAWF